MATLLIVLLMAFNMWMVIYLTWERRTGDTTREKNGKDGGNRTAASEVVGRSSFRMPENEATDCHTCAKCRHGNTK